MTAISRVEVDGKYGIGRGTDNLILPASFDSISPDCVGNQWIIYDKASGLQGLAYVTDSVANCISPSYSHVIRLSEGAAVLSLKSGSDSDVSYHIAGKGTLASAQPYDKVWIDSDGIMRAIRYGTDVDKRSVELYDYAGRRTTDRT
ncbi:MAG: hypothetical protein K2F63_06160, partial [Muribaculaceae bacterium]|nr:hypothetical protein [Muribaculaceae bacterium]